MTTPSLPNPLHQFQVHTLIPFHVGGVDLSFTNASLAMVLTVAVALGVLFFGLRRPQLVPGRSQMLVERLYTFVATMVQENAGPKAMGFFPFVFSLFLFVLLGNTLGMIPHAYTFTSQIIVTFLLAMVVFLLVTLLGLVRHGWGFFTLFAPKGLPKILYPLVIAIELVSYLSRPFTLAIRLFANMMAGHTILKVFAGFSVVLGAYFGCGPLVLNVLLTGFEFMVAFLQAYVFTVLTCIYLHDALYLH